jgi:hypothetical protein
MVIEQLYAFQIIYEMKLKYSNRREAGDYNRPSICSIQQSNRLDYMFVLNWMSVENDVTQRIWFWFYLS